MPQVGLTHASRRLTVEIVRAIRAAPPYTTNKELGAKYGVSSVAAWKARTRVTWKHVDPEPQEEAA